MNIFRYQAIELNGSPVKGEIEAADRKAALQLLGARGLYPSLLEARAPAGETAALVKPAQSTEKPPVRSGGRVSGKDITAFTREMGALLNAAIPIPQALDGLSEEEENPALRVMVAGIAEAVRKGVAFSAALEEHPRHFSRLYVSMVKVGEEAGVLPKVMSDLAALMEHEDEMRGEVVAAAAYPTFVLCFGMVTVTILLTFVMPKLFGMLQDMSASLPLPTVILLNVSGFVHAHWIPLLIAVGGITGGVVWYVRTPQGAEQWDGVKLKLPLLGGVFRAAALSRFARTLGTLTKSGVSLLPALKIVEQTIGNLVLGKLIAQVAEETRGGDSLAAPLRKLGIFPRTVVQMVSVGEESGMLPDMLLKVAEIEERHMRAHTKTIISFIAPVLILAVGAVVGFMVIALLLPIFNMSQALER